MDTTAILKLKELLGDWEGQYEELKGQLVLKGSEANTLEYNLLATEALSITRCMVDVKDALIELLEDDGL